MCLHVLRVGTAVLVSRTSAMQYPRKSGFTRIIDGSPLGISQCVHVLEGDRERIPCKVADNKAHLS